MTSFYYLVVVIIIIILSYQAMIGYSALTWRLCIWSCCSCRSELGRNFSSSQGVRYPGWSAGYETGREGTGAPWLRCPSLSPACVCCCVSTSHWRTWSGCWRLRGPAGSPGWWRWCWLSSAGPPPPGSSRLPPPGGTRGRTSGGTGCLAWSGVCSAPPSSCSTSCREYHRNP